MRLIRCYIENFGGLSGFALEFGPEITVVREQNGFGKTTLAEFLRAMFYGFPRKSKDLDKSLRQKYMPWQGGSFGGNLEFESEGHRYRIERTFGETPKKDTFRVIDLETGLDSSRFSEEIGLELFRLDADSFERSTYLPQGYDLSGLTTDAIQAKLSDLVEDSNDVGNFEKAMKSLKDTRSALKAYRGAGGSAEEAKSMVSELQSQLESAKAQAVQAERMDEAIAGQETQMHRDEEKLSELRGQIRMAVQEQADRQIHEYYKGLHDGVDQTCRQLFALDGQYPNGIPSPETVEAVRKTADRLIHLKREPSTTPQDDAAAQYVEKRKAVFADGVPDEETFSDCLRDIENYTKMDLSLTADLKNMEALREEMNGLRRFSGLFGKEKLEELSEKSRELRRRQAEADAYVLTDQEKKELDMLNRRFGGTAPQDETLRELRRRLMKAQSLAQDANRLEQALQKASEKRKSGMKLAIPCLVIGVLLVMAGIMLMVRRQMIPGGIALAAGLFALIAGGSVGIKQMVSSEVSGGVAKEAELLEKNREALELNRSVEDYVNRYFPELPTSEGLDVLDSQVRRYRELTAKEDFLTSQSGLMLHQAAGLREELEQTFKGMEIADYDSAIADLRVKADRFGALEQQQRMLSTRIGAEEEQFDGLERKIRAFLEPFIPEIEPDGFQQGLDSVRQQASHYQQALIRVEETRKRIRDNHAEQETCTKALTDFAERYAVEPGDDWGITLQRISNDGRRREELLRTADRQRRQAAAYFEEHREVLERQLPKEPTDLTALHLREENMVRSAGENMQHLLRQKQQRETLRRQADQIPELQDAMEQWKQKREADLHRADILDETMELLQKSRDRLSCRYMGTIGQRFAYYMQELMEEEQEHILLKNDLTVRLERQGQSRELAYFSAGQEDLVMLCMRFALVDALFTGEQPFVILDDPFVNLDDQRTTRALAMLQKLGKQRQIVYLTCHSSRTL